MKRIDFLKTLGLATTSLILLPKTLEAKGTSTSTVLPPMMSWYDYRAVADILNHPDVGFHIRDKTFSFKALNQKGEQFIYAILTYYLHYIPIKVKNYEFVYPYEEDTYKSDSYVLSFNDREGRNEFIHNIFQADTNPLLVSNKLQSQIEDYNEIIGISVMGTTKYVVYFDELWIKPLQCNYYDIKPVQKWDEYGWAERPKHIENYIEL